jgi:DUF4097 and DUF4098 domain-containing protein YvlB
MQHRLRSAACLLVCLLVASCGVNSSITFEDGTTHEGNQVTVNGGVRVGTDCTINGNCRTVNGRVSVGSNSHVRSLRSVNGSIELDDNVVVNGDLETVNGGIRVGSDVSVEGNLETVNGGVSVASGGSIQGTLRTVNGGIDLDRTEVTGALITTNGDITLENGSRVIGNLVIRGSKGNERKPPTITLSGRSIVQGDIEIHDEDRGVRLVLIDGGQVTGSTGSAIVERIDGRQNTSPE